jgi:K+-sensing histidine kinase KdpD
MMAENILDFSLKEMQEFSVQLKESATNLYALLENLLEWSRMQRDVIDYNPEICFINYIVKQNIEIASVFAKQKNIGIANSLLDNYKVKADIPMLNTVLRNLICKG